MPKKKRAATKRPAGRKKKPSQSHPLGPTFVIILVAVGTAVGLSYLRDWSPFERAIGRPIENQAELQLALARNGFSPGSIDGVKGEQTRQALRAFQRSRALEATGIFDEPTQQELRIEDPTHTLTRITNEDLNALRPFTNSWKERSTRDYLGHHSILELLAERSSSDPDFIRSLNPQIDWQTIAIGEEVVLPAIRPFRVSETAAEVHIFLSDRRLELEAFDGSLLFHAPVSIAREVSKRPAGELSVTVLVENPNYTFNPRILTTAAAREGITEKFMIQPGPNNPVGTVWIGLNLPSYGIHGTPSPEKVGRTESSGCFRLANWNAETVLHAVEVGTPVIVHP